MSQKFLSDYVSSHIFPPATTSFFIDIALRTSQDQDYQKHISYCKVDFIVAFKLLGHALRDLVILKEQGKYKKPYNVGRMASFIQKYKYL